MQNKKIKPLQQRFNYIYQKWRTQVKSAKQPLWQSSEPLADSLLHDIIGDTRGLCAGVQRVYEELREVTTPDHDMRWKVDLCVEVSSFIVSKASSHLNEKTPEWKEKSWPDASSFWNSSMSELGTVASILKVVMGETKLSEATSYLTQLCRKTIAFSYLSCEGRNQVTSSPQDVSLTIVIDNLINKGYVTNVSMCKCQKYVAV